MPTEEWDSARQIGADFLRTEVDLGITFADIAREAGSDPDKVRRNTKNARTAYDTVLRFAPRCAFTVTEAEEMSVRMAHLKASLVALGESF